MEIFKQFRFEAAHRLDHLPEGHKCRRLHGHSYLVKICVEGKINPDTGFVMDFADIKAICKPLIEQLDHSYLNDIEGLSISTAENLSVWIWQRVQPAIPGLSRVEVWESPTSGCIYRGL